VSGAHFVLAASYKKYSFTFSQMTIQSNADLHLPPSQPFFDLSPVFNFAFIICFYTVPPMRSVAIHNLIAPPPPSQRYLSVF
jgi:hypothetical protein